MADHLKLPRALSEEPTAPKPTGPSDQKIIENLERWANSRGLQPPTLPDHKANREGGRDTPVDGGLPIKAAWRGSLPTTLGASSSLIPLRIDQRPLNA